MLRDGKQCVFDPKVFVNELTAIMIANNVMSIRQHSMFGTTKTYARLGFDLSQIYADKTWVDMFYELETTFYIKVTIKSPRHGTCVMTMSELTIDSRAVADIMYDKFGMIPLLSDPFGFERWLRGKTWGTFRSRDIDMLTRLVEDPYLKFEITTTPLNHLLNASIEENWPEATMVLLRAIKDRGDSETDTAETTMRL